MKEYYINGETTDFPPGGSAVHIAPEVKEVTDWGKVYTNGGVWKVRGDYGDLSGRGWAIVVYDEHGIKVFPETSTEMVNSMRQKALEH